MMCGVILYSITSIMMKCVILCIFMLVVYSLNFVILRGQIQFDPLYIHRYFFIILQKCLSFDSPTQTSAVQMKFILHHSVLWEVACFGLSSEIPEVCILNFFVLGV